MAGRFAGRFSQLYVAVASAGTAAPLLYTKSVALNAQTDQYEVTAFGDTSKVYVAGLPDGKITVNGFMSDVAATSLITAALDGVARKVYAYTSSGTTQYIFGTFFCDISQSVDVGGAATFTSNLTPATPLQAVGF